MKKNKDLLDKLLEKVEKRQDSADGYEELFNYYVSIGMEDEAVSILEKFLEIRNDYPEGECHLGIMYFNRGDLEKAEERFLRALKINPEMRDANFNLGFLYKICKKYKESLLFFRKVIYQDPTDIETLFNTAECCVEIGRNKDAEFFYQKVLDLNPNHKEAKEGVEKIKGFVSKITVSEKKDMTKRKYTTKKILFFSNIDSFVGDIISHLEKNHIVIKSNAKNGIIKDIQLHNPDVIWFEWCDNLVIQASQYGKDYIRDKKVICRLHSYELFEPNIHLVKWDEFVDDLIFVAEHTKEIFESNVKLKKTKTHVIHNAVDFKKYKIPEDKMYNTSENSIRKLAYVGYLNHKKNVPLLLYCYDLIHRNYFNYELHIAGEFQDRRLFLYIHDMAYKLNLKINFDGWQNNINEWFKDKDYIFSTSLFESFHYGAMEGIACGLLPLIHHWYGAEKLYPQESLFNSPSDCLELIKKYESLDRKSLSLKFREEIKKYSKENQFPKIDKLLKEG